MTPFQAGLAFLKDNQQENGSFLSFSAQTRDIFQPTHNYQSPFATSLILSALSDLHNELTNRATEYLLTQLSPEWTMNYWGRENPNSSLYPDDLDDTFCALTALTLHQPQAIDGSALAHIVSLLTTQEIRVGGPYYTWTKSFRLDVDLAVNANIAYFLSLHQIKLPSLEALIKKAISKDRYTSPYYPSSYPVAYFITRSHTHPGLKKFWQEALKQKGLSILDIALATSSLFRLGEYPSIDLILAAQLPDGSWPAAAFCFDPSQGSIQYVAGSPALTTAFCLEALHHSLPKTKQTPKSSPIRTQIETRLLEIAPHLPVTTILEENLGSRNIDLILELAPLFASTLPQTIPSETSAQLSIAALWGWLAYTLYDHFLDQGSKPYLLPLANLAQREMYKAFQPYFKNNQTLDRVLDSMDRANVWEASFCHSSEIPDYGLVETLAERSLGHTLTPLALLFSIGYTNESPEVLTTEQFFIHYLAARQLNDDAHDWKEDLERGQINYVAARLLRQAPNQLLVLQKLFWTKEIISISQEILEQLTKARTCLPATNPLLVLLTPIQASVEQALQDHARNTDFLFAYKNL